MMRKPQKSNLRNHFINKANACQLETHDVCIVDGGALLHKVSWPKTTYSAVIDGYVNFLKNNFKCYSTVVVVFDGYEDDMSTKGQEHDRRSGKTSASVSISLDGKVTTNRELFLSNPSNKVQLIKMLSSAFKKQGFLTDQSDGDADVLIVEKGLSYAKAGRNVVITADDTDIFILMMYHWKVGMGEMFFSTDKIGDQKNKAKIKPKLFYWKISQISATYDHCDTLLFAHAWSGCDTTSAIHQKGKTKILTTLKSEPIRELARCFGNTEMDNEKIGAAGIEIMLKSFGAKASDTLAQMRYKKYMEMVSTSASVQPENLPPTERATYFHALRVHLQVAQWKHLNLRCLIPTEWGFKSVEKPNKIEPIMTDLDAAPEWLLKVVRCNCKTSSRRPCSSNLCSCRRNGLYCVAACGGCHGEGCENSEAPPPDSDNETEEPLMSERNIFDILETLV
ncbi:uncharacterized protein [Clytia hemisphaerica]|uniref:uncharacterized protein isoform X2 n=1 Tax=Clytia hemisphaerica TaxID=252671 RepID=UPI0034D52D56